MKTINTGEKTINKKVIKTLKELLPENVKLKTNKLHVPGIGYVTFYKDINNNKLATTYIDRGQALITIY